MMKALAPLLFLFLMACNAADESSTQPSSSDTVRNVQPGTAPAVSNPPSDTTAAKTYANQRFRNVRAGRINDSTFRITGQGQIFEARFGWVIEDGHNELKEGYESTSEGAPAWGEFSFLVTASKQRPNSTLHLVLFESSAKDGSRQHELPIPLY